MFRRVIVNHDGIMLLNQIVLVIRLRTSLG